MCRHNGLSEMSRNQGIVTSEHSVAEQPLIAWRETIVSWSLYVAGGAGFLWLVATAFVARELGPNTFTVTCLALLAAVWIAALLPQFKEKARLIVLLGFGYGFVLTGLCYVGAAPAVVLLCIFVVFLATVQWRLRGGLWAVSLLAVTWIVVGLYWTHGLLPLTDIGITLDPHAGRSWVRQGIVIILSAVLVAAVVNSAIQSFLDHAAVIAAASAAQGVSEARYQEIFRNSQLGIYRTTPDGNIVTVNPSLLAMLGFESLEELASRNLDAKGYAPEYSRSEFKEKMEREGGVTGLESKWIKRDGTEIIVRENARSVRNKAGCVIFYDGTVEDVTERIRAKEALQASEERFRALAALSPDIISTFDRGGRIMYSSEAATRIHGYRPEEMVGLATFDLIHPEDRAEVHAAFASILEESATPLSVRYRYRNADGSYRWMEAVALNHLENPHIRGVLAISRDISERIRAEQSLLEDERRYRMLFAANPHPMLIFARQELTILEVNAVAIELYGYSLTEFRGLAVPDLLLPGDLPRFEPILKSLDSTSLGGKVPGVWRHRLKSGQTIDVEIFTSQIEWSGIPSYLVLVNNVTERTQFEIKLQQTQKLESLGLLAGGIAHDFNNLLTAILGHASISSEDVPKGSQLHMSLSQIQEAAQRAAGLCRQMLAYSGRGRFSVESVDLSEFVRSNSQLLRVSIGCDCDMHLDLRPELPAIQVDTTQLQQVVMNLVINAAEAVGKTEGAIRLATYSLHADREYLAKMYLSPDLPERTYVAFEVSDNGCGMSADTQARIFDPFFTTKFTGRGLGLAAVLGIVRGHGGAIRVESNLGRGSKFTILFPADEDVRLAPSKNRNPHVAMQSPIHGVLVVDDEPSVRATTRTLLERRGYRVLLACDGLEGLAKFRENAREISIVLLDLTMPRLGGEATFRELRAIEPNIRVFMMSGYDEGTEAERLAGLGISGFLQKPFTAQALFSVVDDERAESASRPK